jgi:hypothetical protein
MHAVRFLHKILLRSRPSIHLGRLEALLIAVGAVLRGRRLSIAGVGRALLPDAKAKHRIKRIDRLASNPHLALERLSLYRSMAQLLIGTRPRPLILVDWSDARYDRSLQLIRASIVVDGRSMTLYEEVHPLHLFDNRAVRERFLAHLRDCLPTGCHPILITDAGFRVSWYQQVEAMGWDWVSRVRGRALYQTLSSDEWLPVSSLYAGARTTPSFFGEVLLTHNGKHPCQLYRVRSRKQGRTDVTIHGERRRDSRSLKCAHRHAEPWLLATSLRGKSAAQVCKLYSYRSQIEGTFRDMKNAQWGFQLSAHRTRSPERLAILVLLATLAAFAAYLTGLAGAALNLQREYQANTSKRRVLSYLYLGLELLRDGDRRISPAQIRDALLERIRRISSAEIA